jgi:hypothetical protein
LNRRCRHVRAQTNVRVFPALRYRAALIGLLALLAMGVILCVTPFAQDPTYHQFADQRA